MRAAALFLGRSCASIGWGGESAAFSRPWLELVRTDVGRGTYNNEAGSVERDLYVRWYAFSASAETFAIEVSVDGRPFEVAARVAALPNAGSEYGVHLLGLVPGRYEVRMREDGGTVSAPVRVRVQ